VPLRKSKKEIIIKAIAISIDSMAIWGFDPKIIGIGPIMITPPKAALLCPELVCIAVLIMDMITRKNPTATNRTPMLRLIAHIWMR
jgi:hypothetical protein